MLRKQRMTPASNRPRPKEWSCAHWFCISESSQAAWMQIEMNSKTTFFFKKKKHTVLEPKLSTSKRLSGRTVTVFMLKSLMFITVTSLSAWGKYLITQQLGKFHQIWHKNNIRQTKAVLHRPSCHTHANVWTALSVRILHGIFTCFSCTKNIKYPTHNYMI